MTLFLLPTRSARRYGGAYPDRIHSISMSGTDANGQRCIHWETNAGQRFTASYDVLDMARINGTRSFMKCHYAYLLKGKVPIVAMPWEQYESWLGKVRAARAAKA